MDSKAALWLAAGVKLVWIVYSEEKYVRVWRSNGEIEALRGKDILTGEDLAPAVRTTVSTLFEGLSAR